MPTPFPGTSVSVCWQALVLLATVCTHKDPFFSFTDLNAVHDREVFFASGAGFCFHG